MERKDFQEVLRVAMNKIESGKKDKTEGRGIREQDRITEPKTQNKEEDVRHYIDSLFEGREFKGREADHLIPGDVKYRAIISLAEAFSKSYRTAKEEERKARGKELAVKILHHPSQLLSEYDQEVIDAHRDRVWYVKGMLIEAILAQIKEEEERQ